MVHANVDAYVFACLDRLTQDEVIEMKNRDFLDVTHLVSSLRLRLHIHENENVCACDEELRNLAPQVLQEQLQKTLASQQIELISCSMVVETENVGVTFPD